MDFSSHEQRTRRRWKSPTGRRASPPNAGSRSNGRPYKVGEERIKYFIAGKPKQDLELPFFTIWRTTRTSPRRRSPARWRPAPAKRPRAPQVGAARAHAADRRRSRRTQSRRTRRSRRRRRRRRRLERRASSCGATSSSGPSAIPLPTLFSAGLAGALDIRRASSGPHIATASSALRSGPQPGRLGLGAGQDRRHPVVDRGDDLVRGRRHQRAGVEVAVVVAALLGVRPLLAGAEAGEGEGLAAVDR